MVDLRIYRWVADLPVGPFPLPSPLPIPLPPPHTPLLSPVPPALKRGFRGLSSRKIVWFTRCCVSFSTFSEKENRFLPMSLAMTREKTLVIMNILNNKTIHVQLVVYRPWCGEIYMMALSRSPLRLASACQLKP